MALPNSSSPGEGLPKGLPPLRPLKRPTPSPAPAEAPTPTGPIETSLMTAAPPPLPAAPPPLPAAPPPLPAWSDASIALANGTKPTVFQTNNPAKSLPADGPLDVEPVEPSRVPTELPAGIGPYRIHELIGEGGMGLVYRAEDTLLKRPVALKVMKPDVAQDERAWKLFLTEAQATAALKDDRIATIYQIGEEQGQFYLAMELLQGESLETRLRRGPVSLPFALWVVRETALGLAVAHGTGFVHRDIKPGNLWLETTAAGKPHADPLLRYREEAGGEDGDLPYRRVKILDFGLVRLGQDEHLRRRSAVGTPAYMAPEQAVDSNSDPRADIFSLGVVLYRMLTGRLPFNGNTTMEVLTALAKETPPPVTKFNPQVPRPVEQLVTRMLSREPLGRPQSATELAHEIDLIDKRLHAPPPPPRSGRNILVLAGVVLFLAAAFAGAWVLMNGGSQPNDVPISSGPANGVLTPQEAVKAIGDTVTVEFEVGVVNRSGGQALLYESEPVGEELTFRVAVPGHVVNTMRKRGLAWPDVLKGAKVRLHGLVTREGRFAEMLVAEVDQFEKIVYREQPKTAARPKDGRSRARDEFDDDDFGKPKRVPSVGEDLPATTGPSQRTPDPRQAMEASQELQKELKEAMEKFFGPIGGMAPNAGTGKAPPKSFVPKR